ncbi:MAG: hypothetical protein ACRDJU_06045, partial [Actinomycetota bacterium]
MSDELRKQFQDAAPVADILERAARLRRRRVRRGTRGAVLALALTIVALAVYVVGSPRPGVTIVTGSPGAVGTVSPSANCLPAVLHAAPVPESLTATVVPAGMFQLAGTGPSPTSAPNALTYLQGVPPKATLLIRRIFTAGPPQAALADAAATTTATVGRIPAILGIGGPLGA